jgi:hypothetical protein
VYDRSLEEQAFLGHVQIKPVLVHDRTVDDWYKCVRLLLHLKKSLIYSSVSSSSPIPNISS